MKKLIITCLVASVALSFTIPEGAENVKRYLDENGNERVSYTLKGNTIAVASIKTNFKRVSVDPVSGDTVSSDTASGDSH